MSKVVLDVIEVSKMLRISKSMVYKLARTGELPSFRAGSRVLFSAEKIEALINGGEEPNEEEPKQNNNPNRFPGTVRCRRLAPARMG